MLGPAPHSIVPIDQITQLGGILPKKNVATKYVEFTRMTVSTNLAEQETDEITLTCQIKSQIQLTTSLNRLVGLVVTFLHNTLFGFLASHYIMYCN